MSYRIIILLVALIASALTAAKVQADITWNITFNDVENMTGAGFDDASFGAARRNTFISITSYLNTVLDANGTIDFTVNESESDGSGALASAGTLYFSNNNQFDNGFAFQHATTNVDPSANFHDGDATFDFGYNWNSELDPTTASELDLFSVALHEMIHALGFSALADPAGNSSITGGNPGVFGEFARFIERGDGTPLFSTIGGASFTGTSADFVSNDLFFGGPITNAANGGNPVRLYAPATFESGSSISHLDAATFPLSVMSESLQAGSDLRTLTAIDRAILQDLGWNLKPNIAVPEPTSASLLLVGTALLTCRRNKRRWVGQRP